MLTRKQIEALCLGCNECEGFRIKGGALYVLSKDIVMFLDNYKFNKSANIDIMKFKMLNKICNIEELRNFLKVNYPSIK